jgi:hypothetical protein
MRVGWYSYHATTNAALCITNFITLEIAPLNELCLTSGFDEAIAPAYFLCKWGV